MGISPLVWGSLLISLSIGDPFLARLDCRRVNLSFCCTSRIKDFCKEQCAGVECGPSFYKGMFNTDGKDESSARDGDTGVAERGTVTVTDFSAPTPSPSAFPTLIPPQSGGQVPVEITPPNPAPTIPLPVTTQSSALSIVDLIDPMAPPAMPPLPNLPREADSTATVATPPHASKPRIRVTPDPRIIRPPESLAFISDFDEEDVGNTIDAQVVTNEQRMEVPSQNGPPTPVDSAIHHRSDTSDGTNGRSEWSVSLLKGKPFPPTQPETVKTPAFAVDGQSGTTSGQTSGLVPPGGQSQLSGQFSQMIPSGPPSQQPFIQPSSGPQTPDFRTAPSISGVLESVIEQLLPHGPPPLKKLRPSGKVNRPKHAELKGLIGSVHPVTPLPLRTTTVDVVSPPPNVDSSSPSFVLPTFSITRRTLFNNTGLSNNFESTTEKPLPCGVAPFFTPCVSTVKASARLLQCCQWKLLPPGCQKLCRYDTTLAEVRSAQEKGECGILHVAPFLECASQGVDNTQCCRVKGVAQKTGPQCEQFCNPGRGLTGLGLQHIVCGSAITDFLQCHHSGIRMK